MQSTLEEILAKHDWISTFTHPPDVASLLRTNEGPSPLQSAGLKTSLECLTAALADLQSDLVLLHNVAASVEARVSRLQSLKQDYETALSPMRRIPSEIAMEILRRAWKGNEFGDISERRLSGFNVFTIREGPWHLGQVCSSWRNVIETFCPELWATMAVEMPLSYQRRVHLTADTAVEMLSVILERSRNHPLDFYFHYDDLFSEVEEEKPQAMERCFDIMVGHSKRWRVVEMTLDPSLLPRLSLVHGKIDSLREAYIYCHDGHPRSGDISAFEVAPKLEKLHLKGMHPGANIRFPVTNLVSFSDARPFCGDRLTLEYLDIVKSAPKLRSFSYSDYEDPLMSTLFPTLRVMSRSVKELSTSSPTFMRSLVLPSLKECKLATEWELGMGESDDPTLCPEDALDALHEMLLQSQCSLTRLSLVDVALDDNLVKIIQITPSLQEFFVEYNEWADTYDPIMQSLVTRLGEVSLIDGSLQHSMVPSLKTISVYLNALRDTHIAFLNSAFVDMVASRVRRPSNASHLTKLRLLVAGRRWSYDLDEAAKNALHSLKGEGLKLSFCLEDEDPDSDEL